MAILQINAGISLKSPVRGKTKPNFRPVMFHPFDATKTDKNGVDKYYAANAGDTGLLEKDISDEDSVKEIYSETITYGSSKATLEALTRSIATKVGKYGTFDNYA